ncbi:MAG: dienelactone hydrolase family protein [Alphaproteobacteria bacterium]|nr:dienelactone hydrolase family protein [Alphaproteobacteria bacterium]
MDQRIIDLYDEYTHRPLDRRVFLRRLADLAGGTAAAIALLPLLENSYAFAATIAADDARLAAERVHYPGATGPVTGYLARPRAEGRRGAVIVIHENRGLNAHIEDVARRVAVAGHVALAADLLSPSGGTPADADAARDAIGKLDGAATVRNLVAAVAWLKARADSNGRVGAVGFCWGGGMVNRLAVAAPDLAAGVVFYGLSPAAEDAAKIKARMLMHYASNDDRINATVPGYEAALKAAGVAHSIHHYPGTQHAFHNDTAGERYNAAAARLAWERTIAFFQATLAG